MGVGGSNNIAAPVSLAYNEQFIANVPDDLLRRILIHEAAHICLGHIFRSVSLGLDLSVWRTACEFSANKIALITGPVRFLDGTMGAPVTLENANKEMARSCSQRSKTPSPTTTSLCPCPRRPS